MEIREDSWLRDKFSHPVFRVEWDNWYVSGGDALAAIRAHASGHAAATYYAKVSTDQIEVVRSLGSVGFYVVDVNVTFGLAAGRQASESRSGNPRERAIREIAVEHHEQTLAIAGTCFRYSRFHLDPAIPRVVADRIKREWVRSYIRKERGECLLVALSDDRPVGFLAVLSRDTRDRRVRIIDLIGVDRSFQGHGIGEALVRFFIRRYASECDYLQVGTQLANTASLHLYEKCGFSMDEARYVMHMHVGQVGSACG